tara:strand:- start:10051 stop:10239 length:189 start_codon:yes stop_codon:yes gene_type:complete
MGEASSYGSTVSEPSSVAKIAGRRRLETRRFMLPELAFWGVIGSTLPHEPKLGTTGQSSSKP